MRALALFSFAAILLSGAPAQAAGYYNQGGFWQGNIPKRDFDPRWLGIISERTDGYQMTGTPVSGTGDGFFKGSGGGINVGSPMTDGTYLYAIDSSLSRISRFHLASGTFMGWFGSIATSPTGGSAGCSGATGITPGWCYGGTSTSGVFTGLSSVGAMADNGSLYVPGYASYRVYRISTSGSLTGWIGGISSTPTGGAAGCSGATGYTPGWCLGGSPTSGSGTGQFSYVYSVAVASPYLYATDDNDRIQRYQLSNGSYLGWIGWINAAPTGGDAGCSGASAGPAPGWCKGGTSTVRSTGDGGLNGPLALTTDSTYLYVTDGGYRMLRFAAASGSFMGWIGTISSGVTGGDPGCSGASGVTPGWCKGGSASFGGILYNPFGLSTQGSYLYVVDSYSSRLTRHNKFTGAFTGWMGAIGSSPSGGDAGCAGATGVTPGWCLGGSATASTANGGINTNYASGMLAYGSYIYAGDALTTPRVNRFNLGPGGFAGWVGGADIGDPSAFGNVGSAASTTRGEGFNKPASVALSGSLLYIVDTSNHRVSRFTESGSFTGWIGRISTAPTGGDAGCSGATGATPGWCLGGTATNGTGFAQLNSPVDVAVSGSLLYVSDGSHRVHRYSTAGSYHGWIGKISGAPTGGDAGCSGASGVTPGWCRGGTATSDTTGNGGLNNVSGIIADGSFLYVSQSTGNRISRYSTSGSFLGWIGKIGGAPTGGDAGCSGASGVTPGWCIGGLSAAGSYGYGELSTPRSLALQGSSLYVVNTGNHRVDRFSTAGQHTGWIGYTSASGLPTGGDPVCTTHSSAVWSRGWCLGGTTANQFNGNGGLWSPYGIVIRGNDLYVSPGTVMAIQRYDLTTGYFVGSLGYLTGTPTGGDVGCKSMTVNTLSPGFCRGANASTSGNTGLGELGGTNGPMAISESGSFLYVPDYNNSRVNRYQIAP